MCACEGVRVAVCVKVRVRVCVSNSEILCARVCACVKVFVCIYMCMCGTECVWENTKQTVLECA